MVITVYFATSAMTEFFGVVNGELYEEDSKMCFEHLKNKLYTIAFISMYFWIFFARIEMTQLKELGTCYFTDCWNMIDFIMLTLNGAFTVIVVLSINLKHLLIEE